MLAGEDHQSGVLLSRIVHWYQYAKIKIPNLPGVWVANDHDFWRKEGRLSRDQISRCLKHLHERCLIERTQFWFGRKSILHVRPSLTVTNFLAEATTWPAAEELFASLQTGLTEVSNSAVPGSAILLNSVTSKSAKPSSAHLLKPKY